MILASLMLSLALQASSAVAAPPAPSPAAHEAKLDDDRIECRSEAVTGTHLSSRTCLRRSEWQRIHDDSVQALGQRGHDREPGLRPN